MTLKALLDDVRRECKKEANRVERETTKKVAKWVKTDEERGLGAVHAWAKNKTEAHVNEVVENDELFTEPFDIVVSKIQTWGKRWIRKGGNMKAREAIRKAAESIKEQRQTEDKEQLTVEMLDNALRNTRDNTGLGTDWLEPRLLKDAPVEAKEELVKQMRDWEAAGLVPIQLLYNLVKLIGKPDGTDRPITLMPIVVRILFKMRGKKTQEWSSERQRFWDAAVKGSSALRATMLQKLMQEVATEEEWIRVSLLWDLEKFYDNISLEKLADAALANGYPADLLTIGLRCYTGPRLLIWKGAAAFWLSPNTSICAGCVKANDMARVLMYDVLDSIHTADPKLEMSQFVDDALLAKSFKTRPEAAREMAKRGAEFINKCREKELVVSGKKSAILTLDKIVAAEVRRRVGKDAGMALQIVKEAKFLGADTTGGGRRARRTAKKAQSSAAKRVERVNTLRKAKTISSKIFRTAAWQQSSFSAPADGMSPTELQRVRRMARASCQMGNHGSCMTTIIAITLGEDEDPAVKQIQDQVKEWLKVVLPLSQEQKIAIARTWVKRKALVAKKSEKTKWHWARGPVTALILSLQRIGWKPVAPTRWVDCDGTTWQISAETTDYEELMGKLATDTKAWLWSKASLHYMGAGAEKGVDFSGVDRHIRRLGRRGLHGKARALKNLASAGYWTESRRKACGLNSDGLCPRCKGAEETPLHRFWECPCNEKIPWITEAEQADKPDGSAGAQKERNDEAQRQQQPHLVHEKAQNTMDELDVDTEATQLDGRFNASIMPAPALAPAHPSEDAKDEEEPWDDLLEEGMHGPWDEPPDDEGFCEWDDWGDEEEKEEGKGKWKEQRPITASKHLVEEAKRQVAEGKILALWLRGLTPIQDTLIKRPHGC